MKIKSLNLKIILIVLPVFNEMFKYIQDVFIEFMTEKQSNAIIDSRIIQCEKLKLAKMFYL